MKFRMFGELTISAGETEQHLPSAPKPRVVLALLLMRVNTPVPVCELFEELWGSTPPATASAALQCHVSQVRKALASALRCEGGARDVDEVLRTRNSSYMLAVDPADIDVFRHRQLHEQGRRALDAHDHALASERFAEGLALRVGPPMVEVRRGIGLEIEARAIEERCVDLEEMRVEALLGQGRYEAALDALTHLNVRHPLREGMQAQYMVALHRTGRRAEALAVYRTLHQKLLDEVGIEPSDRVQELHQQVLRTDTDLDPAWSRPVSTLLARAAD